MALFDVTKEQAMALAGIMTASKLVDDIATTGQCNAHTQVALMRSLYVFEPESCASIYGDMRALKAGVDLFGQIAENPQDARLINCMQYTLALFQLAKQLMGHSVLREQIKSQLHSIATPEEFDAWLTEDFTQKIAQIYVDSIGALPLRIQVKGQGQHLKNEHNAERIRCLLLAGIRSAYLWLQLGGNRMQLFTSRRKINALMLSL